MIAYSRFQASLRRLVGTLVFFLWMGGEFVAAENINAEGAMWVYVTGEGIHQFDFNLQTGQLTPLSDISSAKPSFLAFHPSGGFLYGAGTSLSAFSIDLQCGRLALISDIDQKEAKLCHLSVSQAGTSVLAASYGGGSVLVHRIGSDGRLGERSAFVQHEGSSIDKKRQHSPHAHSINLDPNNRFAFVADLGLDQLVVYRFNSAQGTLEPADSGPISVAPGAGPRHFTFHPNGLLAYAINELDSTIDVFGYDAEEGRLESLETVTTLPEGFDGTSYTAEIVVHPNGQFLYGSNRGHNSIVVFAIDPKSGNLAMVETVFTQGDWPRNFCLDPTGQFLLVANRRSGNVVVFRIDARTGKLTATPHTVELPDPTCIRFLRSPEK